MCIERNISLPSVGDVLYIDKLMTNLKYLYNGPQNDCALSTFMGID